MEINEEKANIDDNYMDPQLCATIACDIYKHLRASEVRYMLPLELFQTSNETLSSLPFSPVSRGLCYNICL